jgi:hypothetical protein
LWGGERLNNDEVKGLFFKCESTKSAVGDVAGRRAGEVGTDDRKDLDAMASAHELAATR